MWPKSSDRRLRLTGLRDRLGRRRRGLIERLGGNSGWLRELSAYYRGLTIQEFWVRYTLVDLTTPPLEFARWRFRDQANVEVKEPGFGGDLPLRSAYHVITCLDVLEHVVNPLQVARHLVEHLAPGGTLFVNFVDDAGGENLVESAAERRETIADLNATLRAVVGLEADGDGMYVKPGH